MLLLLVEACSITICIMRWVEANITIMVVLLGGKVVIYWVEARITIDRWYFRMSMYTVL